MPTSTPKPFRSLDTFAHRYRRLVLPPLALFVLVALGISLTSTAPPEAATAAAVSAPSPGHLAHDAASAAVVPDAGESTGAAGHAEDTDTAPPEEHDHGDAHPDEASGDEASGHQHDASQPTAEQERSWRLWSDASSWPGGSVPRDGDDVVIEGDVLLDRDASVSSLRVSPGSALAFAPDRSVTLESSGNVHVEGALIMHHDDYEQDHVLRFVDVDEDRYQGGGHEVLDSDVGLWFTGRGQALFDGPDRLPWTRAATSLPAGATTLELEHGPTGWQVGDEVTVTPTSAPGTDGHSDGYSHGRVTAVDGHTITLDTPLAFDHPRVNGHWGAEVMNLTRNIHVEGTPEGRAHVIFSHVHEPQHLHDVALRHLGPRQDSGDSRRGNGGRHPITEGVLGRYPLHFHHSFDGTRGSVVENVVVRDSGSRAFVPHASNGITFHGTIAHDVFDTAYWWDKAEGGECCGRNWEHAPPSDDITYHRAVASLIRTDPPFRGFTLAGFELGHGANTRVTDSVAVGVQGNKGASGFKWPGGVRDVPGHWEFRGNVAHNNKVHGLFVWDNRGGAEHLVADSVAYHNGSDGIFHGAYSNGYGYRDLVLFGNGRAGVDQHAQGPIRFEGLHLDGAGISRYGFTTGRHRMNGSGSLLLEPHISGYTDAAVAFLGSEEGHLDVVHPTFEGPQGSWFHLGDDVPRENVYRVQLRDGTAFRLHPASSSKGVPVPEWNARREPIRPFHEG